MTTWLGVAAFALVMVELVAAGVGVVVVRRAWRRLAPQVTPLLAMFGAPAARSTPAPPSRIDAPDDK